MSFEVKYTSRRREGWDWCWRARRERLWKTHLIALVAVSAVVELYASESGISAPNSAVLALARGLLSILWLPIYPLLMFKPQIRTLEMNQNGISTAIGERCTQRSWDDIRSVSEEGSDIIIVGHNVNAFIAPP